MPHVPISYNYRWASVWLLRNSPEGISSMSTDRIQTTLIHSDDLAVDAFAQAMKAKMAASRAKGRDGWETCPEDYLLAMLQHHVHKGDMRDVGCIAMMIHLNRERTT